MIQELNRLIFKFQWKGVDKVTRLSTINDLDISESYNIIAKKIEKTNFLVWAGLRLAIPPHLKLNLRTNDHIFLTLPPSMIIRNNDFNILTKKSKDYYALLISRRAQLSKNALVFKK